MGNRAIITGPERNIGIYLHWNGGRASIEAFCEACRRLEYRDPECDESYALARFCQVCCMFFGNDGLHVGLVSRPTDFLNTISDNGVYVIGKDWKIIQRARSEYTLEGYTTAICSGGEYMLDEEIDAEKTKAMANEIVANVQNMREFMTKSRAGN